MLLENSKAVIIIYTSESKSLALHKKGGNLSKPSYGIPSHYLVAIIEIPDWDYDRIEAKALPEGWDNIAEYHPETQKIGNKFVLSDAFALINGLANGKAP